MYWLSIWTSVLYALLWKRRYGKSRSYSDMSFRHAPKRCRNHSETGCRFAPKYSLNIVESKPNTHDRVQFGSGTIFDISGSHEGAVREEFKPGICVISARIAMQQLDQVLSFAATDDVLVTTHPGSKVAVVEVLETSWVGVGRKRMTNRPSGA